MTTFAPTTQEETIPRWRPGMPRYGVRQTAYKAWRCFDFKEAQWVGNASEDRGFANNVARNLERTDAHS